MHYQSAFILLSFFRIPSKAIAGSSLRHGRSRLPPLIAITDQPQDSPMALILLGSAVR
ncbi:hypothetical protein JHU04_003395 [Brenneria sp. 4F2]|nr:hypothetical protein [Brenneria bubanii]